MAGWRAGSSTARRCSIAATIERMAGHLVTVLEAVAADAGLRLSGLAVLTAGEREQLARVE